MPAAMTLLYSTTLGITLSQVTISSISGAYRDLRLVVTASGSVENNIGITVNGDTAANYSQVNMRAYGSNLNTSSSGSGSAINSNYSTGLAAGDRGLSIFDFLDYAQTDKHKSILIRANHAGEVDAIAGRWASTSAITSITVNSNGLFAVGTTIYLYGISA